MMVELKPIITLRIIFIRCTLAICATILLATACITHLQYHSNVRSIEKQVEMLHNQRLINRNLKLLIIGTEKRAIDAFQKKRKTLKPKF